MFKQGDEVINLKALYWGTGTLLNSERGNRVRVHFENEGEKVLDLNHAQLVKVGVAFGSSMEINLTRRS